MNGKRLAAGLAVFVAGAGLLFGGSAAGGSSAKIDPLVLHATADGKRTSFVIQLEGRADLSAAASMRDQDSRGGFVVRALRREALRTQRPIRVVLESGKASYRSFWAADVIIATGDRSLVDELAARPDVVAIQSNDPSHWIDGAEPASEAAPMAVEPGVAQVHAPDLWARGYTGQGIVVAGADTGVRWTHDALKARYRGWNGSAADHNYSWWDAIHSGGGSCGPSTQAPCDDNGHGTHTTGTMVGADGSSNEIGVAPGAKWIGCRNMDQGLGTPETYIECFQFFLAPTDLNGQNPDPAKRPHIVNDSWSCPPSEGCAADTLRQVVENLEASGIFVEASANSAGPGCSTMSDPPSIYAAASTTGAVNSSNVLAGFSSRGPVTADGSGRVKPDLVAPGISVRSSVSSNDSSYAFFSGTAMAAPHVSGVVALLWSAVPSLSRDVAATKQLLQETANPNVTVSNGSQCGGVDHVPNNHFGWGLVDALAAYNAAPPPPPPPPPPAPPPPPPAPPPPVPPPPPPPPPVPPPPPSIKCRVPRVIGLRLGQAKSRIRSRHCAVGRVRRTRARRAGRVVGQSPAPGAVRRRGFPVKLVVGRR